MDFPDQIARLIDPLSLLIVLGGALLVATAQAGIPNLSAAIRALIPLLRADPEADHNAAIVAVGRIEEMAELRSIACADRVKTAEPFLRRAARRLADAPSADAFTRWASREMEQRRARHAGAIGFWRALADVAPGMGMIGTVIGLIQMFSQMDNVAAIGPGMALAMLTTLYGLILANAVAGPIAARLERLSAAEHAWQAAALERLEQLARAQLPPVRLSPGLRTVS